ncbi:NADAR family protein [Alteromonas sp. KUL49]|uniref:NADAR family protein n=1 Tax=Alteromonas sp. KUL49 TaxID=2480798 RepID=UPI00102F2150|nr:NADAR family protein [Alteromonas sp. KUL49]TAP39203.1 NADAR family protein [Alteromonas sp. KUL49]
MFTANLAMEKAYQFSRFDLSNPLSTCSAHPILLEDENWLTCEHYVQAKCLRSVSQGTKVASLPTGEKAYSYGKAWYRRKIEAYNTTAPILMKRALYIKVQMYEEVKAALLATEERLIIETSQYDYFWGIGRDQRGLNHIGKAWMDIREKLREV